MNRDVLVRARSAEAEPLPASRNVSAIVVTYDSGQEIARCVHALLDAGVKVWVVDNASRDDTVAIVRARFPRVRLLVNQTNRGFAAAVNRAHREIDSEVVLLVNPDCVVSPAAIEQLAQHMRADPDVGVVGPRIRDTAGHVASSAHPFETARTVVATRFGGGIVPRSVRRRLVGTQRRQAYDACERGGSAVPVDWVSGACVAVRRSLLDQLGGLDTGYFMFYEDEELCMQAWQAGATVAYLPTAEAIHVGGASSRDPAQVWPHLYRSLLRFHARHRAQTLGVVRGAVLARALLGIVLGAPRDLIASIAGRPGRRAIAWTRVARIAAAPPPPAEEGDA